MNDELLKEIMAFEKKVFACPSERFTKRSLKNLINSDRAYCVILRDNNHEIYGWVVGFMRNFKIPSGRVCKIAVREDCRGKGIGSWLIKLVEEHFKAKGMQKICAEVRESNAPSLAMFKKNGYKQTETLYGYYPSQTDGIDLENGIKLWKSSI